MTLSIVIAIITLPSLDHTIVPVFHNCTLILGMLGTLMGVDVIKFMSLIPVCFVACRRTSVIPIEETLNG